MRRAVRRRPLAAFVVLAFALSWAFWLGSYATSSPVLFFIGGLGPAMAAAIVAQELGTLRPWLACVLRWRVAPRFYLFALGFPVLLYGAANIVPALLGQEPDLSLVPERLPAYAGTWVSALFLGGLEEPGWRGFALPRLQERLTPVRTDRDGVTTHVPAGTATTQPDTSATHGDDPITGVPAGTASTHPAHTTRLTSTPTPSITAGTANPSRPTSPTTASPPSHMARQPAEPPSLPDGRRWWGSPLSRSLPSSSVGGPYGRGAGAVRPFTVRTGMGRCPRAGRRAERDDRREDAER